MMLSIYCRNAALCLLLLLGNCASYARSNENAKQIKRISLSEYYSNATVYKGATISVRGYLVPQGQMLHLDESPAGPKGKETPTMLVWDSTPNHQLGYGGYELSQQCTDKYVEITGLIGVTPPGIIGMVEIEKLVVFDDSNFSGQGFACYEQG